FTEITEQFDEDLLGGLGWATVLLDVDRDGDLDLYTANADQAANGPCRLLRNDGLADGTLQLVDATDDCGCDWLNNPMGATVTDFDADGLPDVFVTNTGSNNALWNMGEYQFADMAQAWDATVLEDQNAMTYGAAIYDFDNDGWQDILTSSGPLRGDSTIGLQPEDQPDVLLKGGETGFTDVSEAQGVDDEAAGRGVAVGMLDDDGVLEAVVAHLDSPTRIYRSPCTTDRALVVDLVGQTPNTFGVGAWLELQTSERTMIREITTNSGWASTIHPRAHFGLGQLEVESLVVHWPSGESQTVELNPGVDGRISVKEP
ncbi:MAG: CRTAC1 family protein, partial [Myxococcota bacterium]|nr:CRTAC1 family protein [Myxococcota bacterium]